MRTEEMNQLKDLKLQIEEAKASLDLRRIDKHLSCYHNFILGIKNRLREVTDLESFSVFRSDWKESGGIAKLPEELTAFHSYLSLVNQYNAIAIPGFKTEKSDNTPPEHTPILYSREEMDILENANVLYQRPFNWGNLKERLVGPATRKAIYLHAVACLEPEHMIAMIEEGSIKLDTIKQLPYAATIREVNGNGTDDARLYRSYHANLADIYDHFGMELPAVTEKIEPVKGVTFEGRPQKLAYLLQSLQRALNSTEVSFEANGESLYQSVKLTLERYLFQDKNGVEEPAIRILASIPGNHDFQKLDIGNLDRNLAIALEKDHKEAHLVAEIYDIGISESRPYCKIKVQIADKPNVKERILGENRSEELDALLDMEDLK